MARAKAEAVKMEEVPQDEGTVVMAFPKSCWAHVPSDDPKTWYLRMYWEPEDEQPDGDCLMHAVEVLKRAAFAPQHTRLDDQEIPYAKGRLAQAWRKPFPKHPLPDALTNGVDTADMTSAES